MDVRRHWLRGNQSGLYNIISIDWFSESGLQSEACVRIRTETMGKPALPQEVFNAYSYHASDRVLYVAPASDLGAIATRIPELDVKGTLTVSYLLVSTILAK